MSQVEGVGFLRENDLCRSWGVGNCVGHRECGEVIERLLGNHRYGGAEEDLLGFILSGKNHVCKNYKPDKSCSQDISGIPMIFSDRLNNCLSIWKRWSVWNFSHTFCA